MNPKYIITNGDEMLKSITLNTRRKISCAQEASPMACWLLQPEVLVYKLMV